MTKAIGFQQQIALEVIRQAQSGDIDAFESIYRTYADACHSLAFRISGNPTLAQDIVQEVFLKIMAGIGSYRNKGSFPGWIRRIVANETINRIKSESRLKLVTEETNFEPESENLFDHNWLSACRDLDNLLSHLSVTARAVLLLHEVEGYSHFEIAQLYEKSESFSKVTLSRAYNKLRQVAQEQDKSYALNR